MIENYLGIYEARTTLPEFRTGRGGGDVVTTFLAYGLSHGIINRVPAVGMSEKEPYVAEPVVATTIEEVVQCSGSKYTFVSYDASIVDSLDDKSVLVGLPCQLKNETEYLKIGLFCGLNTSTAKLDYLLKWNHIDKHDIIYMDWRSPKSRLLEIRTKRGDVYHLDHWWLNFFFPLKKCLYCRDYTAHRSDLSVGDRRPGWSVVIVRTNRGMSYFEQVVADGWIEAAEISYESFFEKRMSPMVQKEARGGFIRVKIVRPYGRWINWVPPAVLKVIGLMIAKCVR